MSGDTDNTLAALATALQAHIEDSRRRLGESTLLLASSAATIEGNRRKLAGRLDAARGDQRRKLAVVRNDAEAHHRRRRQVRPRFQLRYAGLLLLVFGLRLQLFWLRYRDFLVFAMILGACAAAVVYLGPQALAAWAEAVAWVKSLVASLSPPAAPPASPPVSP